MPDMKISQLTAATTPLSGTEQAVLVQSGITKKVAASYFLDAANLTGSIKAARMPAFTGDATSSAGAVAMTLATVNANVGSFGSATTATTFTVNAKGLITAASSAPITPDWASITSKPTTLAGYAITDAANITHTHSASDITSGIIADARLSGAYTGVSISGNAGTATTLQTARTIGGVSFNGSANINLPGVNTAGTQNTTGKAATATALATGRTIAMTGDLVWTSPAFTGAGNVTAAGTLASVNGNVGSFGSATTVGTFTVDAKGRTTAAGSATITPAWGSVTSKPTSTAAYGFTDFLATAAGNPVDASSTSITNQIGYGNGFSLFGQTDGALYTAGYGSSQYKHQIMGDLRTGKTATRGQNASTWGAWRTVLDSGAGGIPTAVWISIDSRQILYFDGSTNYYKSNSHVFRNNSDTQVVSIDTSGNVAASGDVTAYSSDARLKENAVPITNPLEKIASISGYTFDWKRELVDSLGFTPYQYENEHGFLAQEIEAVIPDAVRPAHFNNDYLTVKYERVIPLAIEGIKALKKENDELRQELNDLQSLLRAKGVI